MRHLRVRTWATVQRWLAVVVLGLHLLQPLPAVAQEPAPLDVRYEVFAGEELEEYLRTMQLAGTAEPYPWSVRGFSAAEVGRIASRTSRHPWAGRFSFRPGQRAEPIAAGWVTPGARMFYNSAFPYGGNDGAVWAGRGLTLALRAGAWARLGPVSLVLAPVVFRAENRSFELMNTGWGGALRYRDARYEGDKIDLPQRFGDGSYSRLSAGQSTLRLDAGPLTLGASTANQFWGPGDQHPLLLGNNAEGYPHAFLGTAYPLKLGIIRANGRFVWGRLSQSEYSPVQEGDDRRFMSGFVGTVQVPALAGLEVGAGRFFHSPWPHGGIGLDYFAKPLEGLLKTNFRDDTGAVVSDQDNQLASVFFRWPVSRAGLEVYGEFAREDHSLNLRDLLLEPDHNSAYVVGARKVWASSPERWTVLSAELMNAEIAHLFRVRQQSRFYVHSKMRQGHTQLGQILGSAHGYGGAAAHMAVDRYSTRGRWTLRWVRALHDRRGSYWQQGGVEPEGADVSHALFAETLMFLGAAEVTSSLGVVYEFNRYFEKDVVNVNVRAGVKWRP